MLRPLLGEPPAKPLAILKAYANHWRFREGMIYLMPAPLYHSAPLVGAAGTIRLGGTLIVMEHFGAEEFLRLVEEHRVTHSQLVPTMFSRMLKLPESLRRKYDPRNGSWKTEDVHKILNYKAFTPSIANAEQLAESKQFQ